MWFEEFQDGHHGSHLWYGNRRIVAILNLYNAPIPPIKFPLNLTYGLGGDVVWRISRWPPWQPSWISEQNHFSNSESLCHCDASHQVLVQSDLQFGGDVVWIISRWSSWLPSWISEQNDFINSESLCHCATVMSPIKFWLDPTYGFGGDVVLRISRWPLWRSSWILEQNKFSHSESLYLCDAFHQVLAQSNLRFGSRSRVERKTMVTQTYFWNPCLGATWTPL